MDTKDKPKLPPLLINIEKIKKWQSSPGSWQHEHAEEVISWLVEEVERLREEIKLLEHEYICKRCGIRQNSFGIESDQDVASCANCGYTLEEVRPGKHQCNYCEGASDANRETKEATTVTAGRWFRQRVGQLLLPLQKGRRWK